MPPSSPTSDPFSSPGPPKPPLDRAAAADLVPAAFALGCFWSPDARFGAVEGVVRTCVGYAGGTTSHPTYDDLGDHIETLRVEYDPDRIDYTELLLLFWTSHDPTRAPFKRQYQPALFPYTSAQAKQARASFEARRDELQTALTTELIENPSFYRAESYHQKHALRRHPALLHAVQAPYPTEDAFVDAPAAALVNGYVGGPRGPRHLDDDLPQLGLPAEAADTLRTIVTDRHSAD